MRAICAAALAVGLTGGLAACAPGYPAYPAYPGYYYGSVPRHRAHHHRSAVRAHRREEPQGPGEWVDPPPEAPR